MVEPADTEDADQQHSGRDHHQHPSAETRVAHLTFDSPQPWKLSPYVLGWLVAVLSAIPTAYSGASGILRIPFGKL